MYLSSDSACVMTVSVCSQIVRRCIKRQENKQDRPSLNNPTTVKTLYVDNKNKITLPEIWIVFFCTCVLIYPSFNNVINLTNL